MSYQVFTYEQPFELESGGRLPGLQIAYHTYGRPTSGISNVVWVFHALTANSDVFSWWPGLFGENDFFNPKDNFIVCANVLGSPYGSTCPHNLDFPQFTVRDVVRAHLLLAEHLQVDHIKVIIGGSFGGSQALEFALLFPGRIENMILVASAANETAWGIAVHESQRLALQADNTFGLPGGGGKGLQAARAVGMLTYRTAEAFMATQTDTDERTDHFSAASYIRYQAEKLERRFDALAYYYLTKCMDSHNVGRGRGGLPQALAGIDIRTLVIGIDSDRLLPVALQQYMARHIPGAVYKEITSEYGHDGFLVETTKLTAVIRQFLVEKQVRQLPARELAGLMAGDEDFQLIDVREPFEVAIASIGGINIPLKDIPARLSSIASGKRVIVYCRSGKRSASAIAYLEEKLGHDNLWNLEGGILAWADEIDNSLEKY